MKGHHIRIYIFLFLLLGVFSCQSRIIKIYNSFGIDLKKIDFSIIEKKEQWYPNGDGELWVRLSFSAAQEKDINLFKDQMLSNGAKELPIETPPSIFLGELAYYENSYSKGLYLIGTESNDIRNYRIIVYDEERKESFLQIMVF